MTDVEMRKLVEKARNHIIWIATDVFPEEIVNCFNISVVSNTNISGCLSLNTFNIISRSKLTKALYNFLPRLVLENKINKNTPAVPTEIPAIGNGKLKNQVIHSFTCSNHIILHTSLL